MGAGHVAELLRLAQAGEGHEVLDVLLVGPAGVRVGEVGEPFDLRGDVRQGLELGGGERVTGRRCRALGAGMVMTRVFLVPVKVHKEGRKQVADVLIALLFQQEAHPVA